MADPKPWEVEYEDPKPWDVQYQKPESEAPSAHTEDAYTKFLNAHGGPQTSAQFMPDYLKQREMAGTASAVKDLATEAAIAGKGLVAGVSDVGNVFFRPVTEQLYPEQSESGPMPLENIRALVESKGRGPLPSENLESLPVPAQIVGRASQGLIESAPKLAAVTAMQAGGVPAPIAAGLVFGSTPEGFDPKQAAVAALLPFVGKYSGAMTEALASKLGVSKDVALGIFNKLGGATGAAGYLKLIDESEIAKLPPEQRDKARIDSWANVASQAALGLMGERESQQPAAEAAQPKETDARTDTQTKEVHGDVLRQPGTVEQKVPTEKGGEGIRTETEGGIPKEEVGPHPTADQLIEMSPAEAVDWVKRNRYGPNLSPSSGTTSIEIADKLKPEDIPKLEAEERKLREQFRKDHASLPNLTPEDATKKLQEMLPTQLKSQIIAEVLTDYHESAPNIDHVNYQRLIKDLKGAPAEEKFGIQKSIEELKNKYGGKVPTRELPKPEGELKESPEPELVGVESRGAAGGNISAFGLFDPANYTPAVRAAAKSTKDAVDAATRTAQVTRKAFQNIAKSQANRHVMDQTLDAADNQANIIGQQQGKSVKLGITPEQDSAASVLVASGFDRARAQEFLQKAQKGKNKNVESIVDYALKNWNSLEPVARRGQTAFENQLRQEHAAGIETERHEDYLPGVYDMDLMMGVNRPFVIGQSRISGVGTGFKKGKVFASPFDAVEAGYTPKSLKLSDLVENRIRSGQRLINRRAWGDSLKSILDPTDQKPIAENLIVRRRPNGTSYEVAPPGYATRELLPGVRMGIHETYVKLFDALTGNTSAIRQFEVGGLPVGAAALQTVGGVKHGMLLLDTYHAMRVMKKEFFVAGKVGYKKGLSLLEYSPSDLSRAVKEGEITQDMADYATANRPTADLLIKNGLNVGRVQQAMYTALVRKIPGIGGFNKWVFEKLTRGAMMEAAIHEFNRVKADKPHMSDVEVARQVSRDLNKYFGNLQRQGVFKSQTMLDISGLAGFAPQWIESQVRSELGGVKQLTVDPILKRQLSVGTLGSGMARGLAAYVAATQIINLATRHKFTWQNDEKDHKLDAWIPDVSGKTGGYWLSPLSGAAENTKDVMDAVSDSPDALDAAGRIMANKSGSLVRAGKILLQGRDWKDQKIIGSWNKMKQAAIQLAPVPIPLSTTVKGGPPGSTQKQIMQSLGEKVKPVKTANQEIGKMARKWGLASKDPKVRFQFEQEAQMDYGDSAFKPVRDALKERDDKKVVAAVQTVLDREPDDDAVRKRLTAMLNDFSPFTKSGTVKPLATKSKENEQKFLESLNSKDKQLWINALKERVNGYRALTKAIYGRAQDPPIPEEYRDLFR